MTKKAQSLARPIALRLPVDVDRGLRERAAKEGVAPSELLRMFATQIVYGQRKFTIDDGYRDGRSIAIKAAHEAISRTLHENLPQTVEEAMQAMELGTPYRDR